MGSMRLLGLVSRVGADSILSWNDPNESTETAVFSLDFILSSHDISRGYHLGSIIVYGDCLLARGFPEDPMACLRGTPLEGVRNNSIIVIDGTLYCADILDWDMWSAYPLKDKDQPFPRIPGQKVFGTPFGYSIDIPPTIPSLIDAKVAKAILSEGSVKLLSSSTAVEDYEKEILKTLEKEGVDEIKRLYFPGKSEIANFTPEQMVS